MKKWLPITVAINIAYLWLAYGAIPLNTYLGHLATMYFEIGYAVLALVLGLVMAGLLGLTELANVRLLQKTEGRRFTPFYIMLLIGAAYVVFSVAYFLISNDINYAVAVLKDGIVTLVLSFILKRKKRAQVPEAGVEEKN